MSFKPEVFWLGKPNVSYFPTWSEMKQAMDDIVSVGWKVATEAELKDAWTYGANWCASGATKYISPTLGDIGIYYAMYPISEEISRSSGGCGSTLGIQVFIASSSGGPTAILPTMTNIGGINVNAIKPNPDFPETIPANTTARWLDTNKNRVLITIRGREYIINSFNAPKNFYNSPKTLDNLIYTGYLVDMARKGYILPANCPDKIPAGYVPPGYILPTSCPQNIVEKIVYQDKIVEKIPAGYIQENACPTKIPDGYVTPGYILPANCPKDIVEKILYQDRPVYVDKIIEKVPDGYIEQSNCPETIKYIDRVITKEEIPVDYIPKNSCPVTYRNIEIPVYKDRIVEKTVEKIPDGYINKNSCGIPTGYIKAVECPANTASEEVLKQNSLFKVLLIIALLILVVVIVITVLKSKKQAPEEIEEDSQSQENV